MEVAWSWVREAILAAGLIMVLIGGMYVATGSWPPMVVVESGSMMHDDEGSVGTIDPGDLVLVMAPTRSNIVTWAEAAEAGGSNENHGMPGDVIIYRKNGGSDTPVIHRAIIRAEAYTTQTPTDRGSNQCENGSWDPITIDSDGEAGTCVLTWWVPGTDVIGVETITVELDYPCHPNGKLQITDWNPGHAGYLTTGDNLFTNGCDYDQKGGHGGGLLDENGLAVTAVRDDWIIGVAGAEIPWVGAIKLGLSANSGQVPSSSWWSLTFTAMVLLAIPMVWEKTVARLIETSPEVELAKSEDDFSEEE